MTAPQPRLSVLDATAMIVGVVVGVGIFKSPTIVAGGVADEIAFIAAWLAGGALSIIGALCYAELGSAYPSAGGEYHFLSRAFGDRLGFIFAWSRMAVIQTGAIVAVAFVLGDYASTLYPLGARGPALYAALSVAALTALNMTGAFPSKRLQNALAAVLASTLLALSLGGLAAAPAPVADSRGGGAWVSGLAMILVMLTYGGWNEASYLGAEMRRPRRDMARALVAGVAAVTLLYVLLNTAYLRALGLGGLRASKAPALDLVRAAWGEGGTWLLGVVVVCSAASTLNGTIFTGARSSYALGRDFEMFRALGRWGERTSAPVNALLAQGVVSLALVLFASFTPDGFLTMAAYTAPAFWLFFLLTGASLLVLRRRATADQEAFRVPLYPLTPLAFCAGCAFMLYSSLGYAMSRESGSVGAVLGIVVFAVGVLLRLFARRPAGEAPGTNSPEKVGRSVSFYG